MKKRLFYLVSIFMLILSLGGCNNKYRGYWCKYNESATIVVLLKNEVTETQKQAIETKINSFENVTSVNFYSKDDYALELGDESESVDIYDTFVAIFDSIDFIGSNIDELSQMDGVQEATQSNAKTNISLYNLKKFSKYTFTNSDEAEENDLVSGKYKIKKGVITFKPKDAEAATEMLYIKDGYLCGDVDCNEIYAQSDETCSSIASEE